jgi:hypothetical protein
MSASLESTFALSSSSLISRWALTFSNVYSRFTRPGETDSLAVTLTSPGGVPGSLATGTFTIFLSSSKRTRLSGSTFWGSGYSVAWGDKCKTEVEGDGVRRTGFAIADGVSSPASVGRYYDRELGEGSRAAAAVCLMLAVGCLRLVAGCLRPAPETGPLKCISVRGTSSDLCPCRSLGLSLCVELWRLWPESCS